MEAFLVGWLSADGLGEGGDSILAQQPTLRPGQLPRPVEIENVEIGGAAAPGIDTVDEDDDRGVAAGILADARRAADAAHREVGVDRIDRADGKTGGAGRDVLDRKSTRLNSSH